MKYLRNAIILIYILLNININTNIYCSLKALHCIGSP
jgi:hypothetical protein